MTSLMQGVIEYGTGSGVRARGFRAPAAGKTGTSHDGWFAGYTSNLLCVVWVGYDSNQEFPLPGAMSALPIWTEFMKRAIALPEYSHMTAPVVPAGIVQVELDPQSGDLATANCPRTQREFFLEGTQPTVFCRLHTLQQLPRTPGLEHISNVAPIEVEPPPRVLHAPAVLAQTPPAPPRAAAAPAKPEKPKKRGFFGRIIGFIKGQPVTEDNDPQQ
jgi:penicillin-binding protein 1B